MLTKFTFLVITSAVALATSESPKPGTTTQRAQHAPHARDSVDVIGGRTGGAKESVEQLESLLLRGTEGHSTTPKAGKSVGEPEAEAEPESEPSSGAHDGARDEDGKDDEKKESRTKRAQDDHSPAKASGQEAEHGSSMAMMNNQTSASNSTKTNDGRAVVGSVFNIFAAAALGWIVFV